MLVGSYMVGNLAILNCCAIDFYWDSGFCQNDKLRTAILNLIQNPNNICEQSEPRIIALAKRNICYW